MELTAHVELGAVDTLDGTPLDWSEVFGPRTEAHLVDRYPASVDGRPVLIYAGRIYTADEWAAALPEHARRLTVGRISDGEAEAIRAAGWTLSETFAAEDRDLRPEDLIERRRRLGLSQAELGRRLGTNSNTISRWERGDAPIGNPRMLDLALKALERGA